MTDMAELVKIEGTELAIREYNGQRVVTLKDIDRVHGKRTDTAKKAFQKHKKHFILGEDYFEITRKELGERYSPKEKIKGSAALCMSKTKTFPLPRIAIATWQQSFAAPKRSTVKKQVPAKKSAVLC